MTKSQDDKQQIGLTSVGDEAIQVMVADGRFANQADAYRFAIAFAIAAGLDPAEAPQGGYNTKFNAIGTLESGTRIRDLIDITQIGEPDRPFATCEKLAELGVREIARRLEGSESLADILASTAVEQTTSS